MAGELLVDVDKAFPGGATVVARSRIPLEPGGITVLFGPSGAGKSTVLRLLAGLERPDHGTIRFDGEVWFDARAGIAVSPQRRRVGFVAQDYALFPHLTVRANVAYGLAALSPAERRQRLRDVLRLLRIDDLEARRPGELSGGQRQRVALARALVTRPRLLLLDEPLSALDAPTRDELRRELRRLLVRLAVPSVLVTHDRNEALSAGDHALVMAAGLVRQEGPIEDVFSRPAAPDLARILGIETVVPARFLSADGGLATIAVGTAQLVALDPGRVEGELFACIRGEDVTLERSAPQRSSARNHIEAAVVSVSQEGPLARIALDCGFPLVALVTRLSVNELRLAPGERVVATVNAPAVRLVPHGGPTLRA